MVVRAAGRLRSTVALLAVTALVTTGAPAAAHAAEAGAPASSSEQGYPLPGLVRGDVLVHDPSMVRTPEGYLLYSTHNGIEVRSSSNRIDFDRVGPALAEVPAWVDDYNDVRGVWAPDVSHHRGTYWMYYTASSFGSNHSAIGLATSPTGRPGTFTDQGIVISSTDGDDFNAIDPSLLVTSDGSWWLSLGSFWTGIRMIRLDPETGHRHPTDRTLHHLATRPDAPHAVEAPHILERNGYYYLFVSHDHCCSGVDSTYRVMVGRSTSPTGPYVDRDGVRMLDGGGTEVLSTHGTIIGPGGQSVLSDVDGDLLVYHYYDGADHGRHKLGVNLLDWSGGWPSVH
ncbi:arabinan endo-1,5-alpha-L-arabinosidase [Actinoalloteichus sp. AHMU CJ021]|uniref:Arabinan endo-1,5-alpha-L-arabinosidase n=1 Tax=Actinoalloteichus caeruleus DSM 43889 TaxID=1120930 RepID=A0ABT1JQ13_ACTCY|nr:arabinan endo-1,5-alpha-L-arabinosidase [Actinoalloteichus caeruleus]AUS80365.1 arabinan endo-1,5-alpha-L-arabinosidase [Actinoalloteichus sp. AHMU CJ021]MCP2334625.1 arabinan endo-1,5-alpha-L-arabinosidase [Actinoalloteichus caeruleus DSM 43889]